MGKKKRTKRRTSYYNTATQEEIYGPEDEIRNYQFHPHRRSNKSNKANNNSSSKNRNVSLVYRNDDSFPKKIKGNKFHLKIIKSELIESVFIDVFSTNYYLTAEDPTRISE